MRAILTPNKLTFLKQRAIRKRVWFKIPDRAEWVIVDLTIRTVKRIRSSTLKEILMTISEKLMEAMESQVARFTETIGHPLAQKIARLAFSWGNREALKWPKVSSFIRHLTTMEIDTACMISYDESPGNRRHACSSHCLEKKKKHREKVKTVGVPVFVTLKNRSAKLSFRMLLVTS